MKEGESEADEGLMSVADWKKELKESVRDRLRDEYAAAASKLCVGCSCEVGEHSGEICFVGDSVPGLPGGAWVGIRLAESFPTLDDPMLTMETL